MEPIEGGADWIPQRVRAYLYRIYAAAVGVELALEAVGWGVIPDDVQGKLAVVVGLLLVGQAAVYTPRKSA
jgi:hypothetical protein